MRKFSGSSLAILILCSSLAVLQDKPKTAMMTDVVAAKKLMLEPKAMESAQMMMMDEKSMLLMLVAKEMLHQEMLHDKDAMGMIAKRTMMVLSDDMMMMNDKHVEMATERQHEEKIALRTLFRMRRSPAESECRASSFATCLIRRVSPC